MRVDKSNQSSARYLAPKNSGKPAKIWGRVQQEASTIDYSECIAMQDRRISPSPHDSTVKKVEKMIQKQFPQKVRVK